jgi:hypothetical protein
MATVHIDEIGRLLAARGDPDAAPWSAGGEGFFLEIRFDRAGEPPSLVDPDYQDKVLCVESASGSVIIQFDHAGLLRSIDLI